MKLRHTGLFTSGYAHGAAHDIVPQMHVMLVRPLTNLRLSCEVVARAHCWEQAALHVWS
jgi:hypothetical protein